jgi:hypothetical protein
MPVTLASAHLSDDDFLAAFHSCALPNSEFRHGDHLRLAWLQLHRYPLDEALSQVREGISNFARHNGAPHLFHETVTCAWVRLLATHDEATFSEFLEANVHRLNLDLLHRFWSRELLESEAARREWVRPDLGELPQPVIRAASGGRSADPHKRAAVLP